MAPCHHSKIQMKHIMQVHYIVNVRLKVSVHMIEVTQYLQRVIFVHFFFFDYTKGPKSLQSRRHIYQYVDNLFCRAETGFRHVEAVKYTPRLIHVSGDKVKG